MTLIFANPWWLVLLIGPIALIAWTWARRARRVVLPFDHGRQRSGTIARVFINLAESVPALVLAVVVVILAGPQRFSEPKEKRVLTNIEFAVDISGSMTAQLGEGTRYDASMKAIDEFLSYRPGDAFGLTFFGDSVMHWVPLTEDVSAIRCAPPFMRPEIVPPWFGGGTFIGRALLACKKVLEAREEGERMIVLVSDGLSSDLGDGQEEGIAATLKAARITLYLIHTDSSEVPGPLITLTANTGGEAFAADDPGALKEVFARIDAMSKTRMEKTCAELMDDYSPWCIAGLALLGVTGLVGFGLRYTPW